MKTTALIIRNSEQVTVDIDPVLLESKSRALEAASAVFAVDSATDQAEATKAILQIKQVRKEVEVSRKACKAELEKPVKLLDATAKRIDTELQVEEDRMTKAVNVFQAAEQARAAAAERARQAEIKRAQDEAARVAREAEEARRKAAEVETSFADTATEEATRAEAAAKEAEAIKQQEAVVAAQQAKLPPTPARSSGMAVTDRPMFEVTDIHALYKAAPGLVRIEANTAAINSLLRTGVTEHPGLKIWREIQTSFRN